MDDRKEIPGYEQRVTDFTSHMLFLDSAVMALLLAADGREDVALCNAMAQCLASLPWVKALQRRIEFDDEVELTDTVVGNVQRPLFTFYLPWHPRVENEILHFLSPMSIEPSGEDCEMAEAILFSDLPSLHGVDFPEDRQYEKCMALAAAVASGQRDIVALVASTCSRRDHRRRLLLPAMCMCPNEDVFIWTLNTLHNLSILKRDDMVQLVLCACRMGYLFALKAIHSLLSSETSVSIHNRAGGGSHRLFSFSPENAIGYGPIHFACQNDSAENVAVVKYLIEVHGVDVNANSHNSWTPLHVAAYYGSVNVIRYLLERSSTVAVIDAKCLGGDHMFNILETPLFIATRRCLVDVVRYLVARGADASLLCKHIVADELVNALECALIECYSEDRIAETDSLLAIAHVLHDVAGCRVRSGIVRASRLPDEFLPFMEGATPKVVDSESEGTS